MECLSSSGRARDSAAAPATGGRLRRDLARFRDASPPRRRGALLPLTAIVSPAFLPVAVYRFGAWADRRFPGRRERHLRRALKLLFHLGRKAAALRAKCEIDEGTDIGPGLLLSARGGIVIGAVRIGADCTVGHNVTIGGDGQGRKPSIGDGVTIEADTLLYGGIGVGDRVLVRAGSVLTKSVPPGCTVQGNPARIVARAE